MSERDFVFWLKGLLAGKESLDANDIRFIEYKIDDIFKEEKDKANIDLSEIVRRASK